MIMKKAEELLQNNQELEKEVNDLLNLSPVEYAKLKCQWYNDEIGNLDKEDGINCDVCHNKGKIAYVDENGNEFEKDCDCMKQRRTFIRLKKCGVSSEMLEHYTFSNFICKEEWQKSIKEIFIDYCKSIASGELNWLLMCGASGSGKTHLCTATFQKLVKSGMSGEYLLWNEEVPKILSLEKSSYEDNQIKYEKRLKFLQEVDLLYIDDFLKLTLNKWNDDSISLAYKIINSRYNNNKITIISSEFLPNKILEMDSAIFGRINEKSKNGKYILNCGNDKNKNYRLRKEDN